MKKTIAFIRLFFAALSIAKAKAKEKKILVLIDEANVTAIACYNYGKFFDWHKFNTLLDKLYDTPRKFFKHVFIGLPPIASEKYPKKLAFCKYLETQSFTVKTIVGQNRGNGLCKANVDTFLIDEALKTISTINPDVVVLVSGDRDYIYMVKQIRQRGIRVELASAETAASRELRSSVDAFINLNELYESFDNLR
jgi:uncharacterized LabA/DUF88 family protein